MDWYLVTGLIAMISLFATIALDMVSRAFGIQGLKMWVKSEYMQVGASFLIIIFAASMQFAGLEVLKDVTASVSAASGNIPLNAIVASGLKDPFRISKTYIAETLIGCQSKMYYLLTIINYFVELVSSFSLDVLGIEAISGGFFLSGPVSLIKYLANNIIYLVLFNYVQYYLLTFSQYTMLQIFLPLGLALRAFPLTRGAGGLVTAFALGFAFVYPMTYVLAIAMMPNSASICTSVDVLSQSNPFDQEEYCFNNEGGAREAAYTLNANKGFLNKVMDTATGFGNIMYLQAVFYPLLSLIVTFTFIRQTGSLFGADLAEIGRGLIKII